MNFNADRPIDNRDQDLLGRTPFAKHVAKAIYGYNWNEGLVIGLFGKWGSGKTSVINMVRNELSNLAENDENRLVIIQFTPWNYSDRNNLISIFFEVLKQQISSQIDKSKSRKIGEALSDYADAVDVLNVIPFLGSTISKIVKTIVKNHAKKMIAAGDLDSKRKKLMEALQETGRKILIIIDDIDRLENSQIRDIFQLVKQVADFPNILYLLSMDREVVSNALTEVHNINGDEYIEKIIQIPFQIPEMNKFQFQAVLEIKIKETIKAVSSDITWDNGYWTKVYSNCVSPYIHTLRDINRVINTFQFRFSALHQETSVEDLIAITTLEVLEPRLYKWIYNNKDTICVGSHDVSSGEKEDLRSKYIGEFEKRGINPDQAIKYLSTLFPKFDYLVNKKSFNYLEQVSFLRGKMRVGYYGRLDFYFVFNLEHVDVPRDIINNCIKSYDLEELISVILEINNQEKIIFFLQEIHSLIKTIPYNRIGLFATAMIRVIGQFEEETFRGLKLEERLSAEDLVFEIIKKLNTTGERYDVISESVSKVDKHGLATVARIINIIELSYGRLAASHEDTIKIISLKQLEELEKLYVTRIREISGSENLLESVGFDMAFYLWKSLDDVGAKNYISNLFKDNYLKLKFICSMAVRWNESTGGGWIYKSEYYLDYITDEEVYDLIKNLANEDLAKFSGLDQIKLASFVLNYERRGPYSRVSEQEALKYVQKVKNEGLCN